MNWTGEYYECSGCGEVYACAYKTCPTCRALCRSTGRLATGLDVLDVSVGSKLVGADGTSDAERIFLSKAIRFKRNDGRIDSEERAQLVDFAEEFGISPLRREGLIEQVECEYESGSAPTEDSTLATSVPLGGRAFADFVLETAKGLTADGHVFLRGSIPARKIFGACKTIMPGGNAFDILVLVDNTVFGGSTDGVVLAEKGVWFKNIMEQSRQVRWGEISSVMASDTNLHIGCYEVNLSVLTREIVKNLADVIEAISVAFQRMKPDKRSQSSCEWAVGVCSALAHNSCVYIGHNMLDRKLMAGMGSMHVQEDPDDVFMQIDTTVFGGAKDGLILTKKAIYWKNIMEAAHRIAWKDFHYVQADGADVLLNGLWKCELAGLEKGATAMLADVMRRLAQRLKDEE